MSGDRSRSSTRAIGVRSIWPAGTVLGDEVLDHRLHDVVDALSGVDPDGVALGIDEGNGRPGPRSPGVPDGEVGIVHDRMTEVVALRYLPDVVCVGLIVEFG